MLKRNTRLTNLVSEELDVLIVGGGITGATLYHDLCRQGYRVAIVDKGDFACGTSQVSGMLIWGGLLYLKYLDLLTVRQLCRARDELIQTFPHDIECAGLQYRPSGHGMPEWMVMIALYVYWLLGSARRRLPKKCRSQGGDLIYEEAMLRESDSRFVSRWIVGFDHADCIPVNYCEVVNGQYERDSKHWELQLRDTHGEQDLSVKAQVVINCAGIWTDGLNDRLGIVSPYCHALSKGVYLNFARTADENAAMVYELDDGDVITRVPWGPVTMWGCTETPVERIQDGISPDVEDVRYLLKHGTRYLGRRVGAEDIVSIRCGVRPLAVRKGFHWQKSSLALSRKYLIADDKERQALAVYGGKLTSSRLLAANITALVNRRLQPRDGNREPQSLAAEQSDAVHHGQEVSLAWARDHELCVTLEDYLRRRTNISQWVPRMGLGRNDEHRDALFDVAKQLHDTPEAADQDFRSYATRVRNQFDDLIEQV